MILRKWTRRFLTVLALGSFAAAVHAADEKPNELLQMVVDLLGDKDKDLRAVGLEQVRTEAKGPEATKVFAAQLAKLDAPAQVSLLGALADRGDATARPAVLALVTTGSDENVRAAALAALGKLGTADDLPLLIRSLGAKTPAEQTAARTSLALLPGDAVAKAIAAESKSAAPEVRAALIEALATRRAMDEIPAFIAATVDDNPQVRTAAVAALGQLAKPDQLPALLPGVLKAVKGPERDAAEKNVALVCARMEDADQRGDVVVKALETVGPAQRDELLSLVGRIGGKKLINFVGDIATGKDVSRRKLGIDALGKWPDASTANKLLEITQHATDPAERSLAYRNYVKVCAVRDQRTDAQRLERMKQALSIATTRDEQALVIKSSRTAYAIESMRFVLPYVDQPALGQIACETIVELAHHREVRDPNKAEFDKALDKVIAVSKDPVVVDRAQRYKRGETWTRPAK